MLGSIFVSRNPVTNNGPATPFTIYADDIVEGSYDHEIRAMGGFWVSRFGMLGTLDQLRFLMLNALGADMKSYSTTGALAFHGFVFGLVLNFPGGRMRFDLSGVGNRTWSRYLSAASGADIGSSAQEYDAELVAKLNPEFGGAPSTTRSTKVNDLDSQALYGIIENVMSAGIATAAVAEDLAQNYLNVHGLPAVSFDFVPSDSNPNETSLDFKVYGYYRTLGWRTYAQTISTGNANASDVIQAVITDVGQFVDSSNIVANTLQVPQVHDADRRADKIIFDIVRQGDSSNNRHVIGVYEDRKIIYKQIPDPTDPPRYTRKIGEPFVRLGGQGIIPDIEVRPGEWLRAVGLFPYRTADYATLQSDPSVQFVEAVRYNEGAQYPLELTSSPNQDFEMLLARSRAQSVSNL